MKNMKQDGYTVIALLFVVFWVACVAGWLMNIYKLITTDLAISEFTIVEVLQCVGIFVAPLGVILGYWA